MNVDCGGLKFKLMLCLNKLHDIGICERVEMKLHKCLPSAPPMTSGIRRVKAGSLPDAVWMWCEEKNSCPSCISAP